MKTKLNKLTLISIILGLFLSLTSCSQKNQAVGNYKDFSGKVPQKIVSLSPAATEIIFASGAGAQLAARTDFCNWPAEAESIPSTGGFDGKTISFEKILSFSPDMVYLTDGMHNYLIPSLEQSKINYYLSSANSIKSIIEEIKQIGKITGHSDSAEKIASEISEKISEISKKVKNLPETQVFWEIWNNPFMTAGKNSFITELIELAGGKNIFSDLETPYPQISEEAIITRNPQAVIIPENFYDSVYSVKKRAGWENLSAVKNNMVFALNTDLISRPGPRIAESLELLANTLHPEK